LRLGFQTRYDRFVPLLLGIAIAISAAFAIYSGRLTTFTPDEWSWIIASTGMDLQTLFQTSTGHLQVVPRAVYKVMLEGVGTDYIWWRVLAVASLSLMVVLLYRYLSRRVGAMVALVPCILLLFFGADAVHIIRGNGFTIQFAIACGIGALLVLEREDRKGDILACLLLILGVGTYTIALPFVVGAGVYLMLGREWKRLWVPVIPLALIGGWRLWLKSQQELAGDLYVSNLLEVPRWIFDALSSILSALTGFGYGSVTTSNGLANTTSLGPDGVIGPLLAAVAIAATVWRLSRGSIGRGVWVTISIGVTLWTIQCLASDPSFPGARTADETRYLYPGAVVVFMIAAELCAGKVWSRYAFAALVVVGVLGLVSNIGRMHDYGDKYRESSITIRQTLTATSIALDEKNGSTVRPSSEPVIALNVGELVEAMARRPFGGIDLSTEVMLSQSNADRVKTDQSLVDNLGLKLTRDKPGVKACTPLKAEAGDGTGQAELPAGSVVLKGGQSPSLIKLGRFADSPSVAVGTLPPGGYGLLAIPQPRVAVPWSVSSSAAGVKLCRP